MWKKALYCMSLVALCAAGWGVGCGVEPNKEQVTETNHPDGGHGDTAPTDTTKANDAGGGDTGGNDAKPVDTAPAKPLTIEDLKPGQWTMVPVPADSGAICSRGSEYAFFVRKGTVNKVVIDFEGGGACWSAETCAIADALFKDSIDNLKKLLTEGGREAGIYATQNEKNPFKGWHHVFVPYCTGDVHWGDNVKTYTPKSGDSFDIRHKGAVNSRTVLKWAFDNVKTPEKVFVTGCSAGAYGSIMWSAHIAKQYKDAKIYHMGDSGAGVITNNFLRDSFPIWNAEQSAPAWIEGLDPTKVKIAEQTMAYMYNKIAAHYNTHLFSQYNSSFDETQVFFFQAMGGGKSPQEWNDKMRALIKDISDNSSNFRHFIAPGKKHCVIPYDEFYSYEVDGVKLVDWVTDMVNDKDIKSHACEGDKCDPPKP